MSFVTIILLLEKKDRGLPGFRFGLYTDGWLG